MAESVAENTPKIQSTALKTKAAPIESTAEQQISLFSLEEPQEKEVIQLLKNINLLTLTPLEAINELNRLQQKLQNKES